MSKLVDDRDENYILNAGSVWITAGNVSVFIKQTRARVTVQLLRKGKEDEGILDIASAQRIFDKE